MTFRTAVCLSALIIATSYPALAQSDQEQEMEMDEVYTTANILYLDRINALKSPTPIIDVPQSLSIITAEQITQQGFSNLGDIISYTPGVSTSQGEGHRDAVIFRGVRSTADFFIDGVRDDVQYYRPLYNLEQVEILRGPNALMFGRGGTGGILNRVTKKAQSFDEFTAYKTSLDTFGQFDLQLDSNFVLKPHSSAVRVNGFYEHLNNHRDFYSGNRWGLNPTVRTYIGPSSLLNASYEYVDHERFIDRGIPTGSDGRPVKDFKDIVFADPELNQSELQAHLFKANIRHTFSNTFKGHLTAFYGDYDKSYQNVYVSDYSQSVTPDEVTLDGYIDTTQRQNFILSGNLIGSFKTGSIDHMIVMGGEYIDTRSDSDRYNTFWDTTLDDNEIFKIRQPLNLVGGTGINATGQTTTNDFTQDLNDDTHVNINAASAYIQDEITLTDSINIVVGARFDSFDIDVYNVPINETRTRQDENISPRLGLVIKPHRFLSFYGSYSETFLPRSGEQFANINGNNNALDPNIFTNLEAGIKWDPDMALSLTAAIFEIEQSSPQISDNDPTTLDVIDSQTQGFEFQISGELTDRWNISGGYSYLDGEIVNRNGPTGKRPRELPKHMISVWNNYEVNERLGLGLGLTYQDESFINNSQSAILPAYTRLDAAAFYDISPNLRLQVNIENLTDQLYFPNAHSTHQVTVGAPINARLTLSGKF